MSPTEQPTDLSAVVLRAERRAFFASGGVVCAFAGFALLEGRGIPLWMLVQVLWGLLFVLAGVALTRVPAGHTHWVRRGAALSTLLYVLVVKLTGGINSPTYAWLVALPLTAPVLFREDRVSGVLMSIGIFVGGTWLSIHGDRSHVETLLTAMQLLASGVLSVVLTSTLRRAREETRREYLARTSAQLQLQESETRRSRSERLALVGQLAAGVAHEVNNPLGYIRANLHHLRGSLESPTDGLGQQELREVLAETLAGVEHIRRVVADLRTFGRDDGEGIEDCSLSEIAEDAVRLASLRKRSVRLQNDVPPSAPMVRMNRQKATQAPLNLLANAQDACEVRSEGAAIRVSMKGESKSASLVVEDNGPGIPEANLPRVFEPFFTTKPRGERMGLGLAMAREHLLQMGGALRAENRESGGARFVMSFERAVVAPTSLSPELSATLLRRPLLEIR